MPGYKGHLAGGAIAFGVLFIAMYPLCPHPTSAFLWFACSCAGSLFPDIDVKSKGQHYAYWFLLVIFSILIFLNKLRLLAFLSVLSLTPMLTKHRGFFHRISSVIGIPLISWLIIGSMKPLWIKPFFFYTFFFIAGAISHLWLDFGTQRMRW